MPNNALDELCARRREQIAKLIEIQEITQRIAEAASRRDELSLQLMLGEREQPILRLRELEEGIESYLLTRPEAEAIRLHGLLRGAEAASDDEKPLAELTEKYRHMLEAVVALDRRVSEQLGGKLSFYKKFNR